MYNSSRECNIQVQYLDFFTQKGRRVYSPNLAEQKSSFYLFLSNQRVFLLSFMKPGLNITSISRWSIEKTQIVFFTINHCLP